VSDVEVQRELVLSLNHALCEVKEARARLAKAKSFLDDAEHYFTKHKEALKQ